jgi:hypothetical protein
VRIPCGCPHAQHVLLFNKAGVEDPREILDRLHGRKSTLENIVSYDSLRHIDSMGRVWVGSAQMRPLIKVQSHRVNGSLRQDHSMAPGLWWPDRTHMCRGRGRGRGRGHGNSRGCLAFARNRCWTLVRVVPCCVLPTNHCCWHYLRPSREECPL